jgi:hypothetical protein
LRGTQPSLCWVYMQDAIQPKYANRSELCVAELKISSQDCSSSLSLGARALDLRRDLYNAHIQTLSHRIDFWPFIRSAISITSSPFHPDSPTYLTTSSRYAFKTGPAILSILTSGKSGIPRSAREGPKEIMRIGFFCSWACLTSRNAEYVASEVPMTSSCDAFSRASTLIVSCTRDCTLMEKNTRSLSCLRCQRLSLLSALSPKRDFVN